MAYTYRNLEDLELGRQASASRRGSAEADILAQKIIDDDANKISQRDLQFDAISQAKQEGIKIGSAAGASDAAKMFAAQGFIPPHAVNQFEHFNAQIQQEDDQSFGSGLGLQPEITEKALNEQATNISDKLIQATLQGAGDDDINSTIDQLDIPPQLKMQAAKMYIAKKQDIESQKNQNSTPEEASRSGLVKAVPRPSTIRAFNIVEDTERRSQELMSKLSQQQQQQNIPPQQG